MEYNLVSKMLMEGLDGGRETMCEIMNKLSEKAAREAYRNRQIEVALTMIKDGELSVDKIEWSDVKLSSFSDKQIIYGFEKI